MEGPSLVILKEEANVFIGKTIIAAGGASKLDKDRIVDKKIIDLKTWGKHFLILFDGFAIRIHYLMFGNYYLNSKHPEKIPKLAMEFANREWNNYNCAVKYIEEDLDTLYDWTSDIMSKVWSEAAVREKLKAKPNMLISDALLDQTIFSGVGNIIKNEVLYRVKIHPESLVGCLPPDKLTELITEARNYSFQFYYWKKEGTLRKHWLAHTKKICTRCDLPFVKKHTGVTPRRSFYCTNCQVLYAEEVDG